MKLWGLGALAISFAAAGAGLMTASCSDSNLGTQGDGGSQGCPANEPSNGSSCFLANNTTCNYNAAQVPNCECCGGGATYICTNGKWEEEATAAGGAGTGAAPACPVTLPEAGSPCTSYGYGGCGAPAEQLCSYDCAQGGTQNATCNGSEWTITTSGDCSGDGGADAGDGGDASDGG